MVSVIGVRTGAEQKVRELHLQGSIGWPVGREGTSYSSSVIRAMLVKTKIVQYHLHPKQYS